ncbi:MAG: DUF3179 domain-containing protein [Gemmatimonadota bacterium]|nr:DUF3179 domain-containing protein [Gemmatimonadota bacterium]
MSHPVGLPFSDRRSAGGLAASLLLVVAGCSDGPAAPASRLADCSIPLERFTDGGTDRSGIPALTNPKVALRGTPDIAYLSTSDRVIGIEFNGQPLAIPHKILWWHEIVNLEVPGERRTVTYSPLTGSAMVFDPAAAGVDSFRVSGYVLDTNLVMEDGTGTLWPQMTAAAGCGPRDGVALSRLPYQEMSFGAWISLHQDTWTVSSATGFDFFYTLYPYGDYRQPANPTLLYPISGPLDTRRAPKERVLGVPAGSGGIAFPLATLAQLAAQDQQGEQSVFVWAASASVDGEPVVAFWNSFASTAVAYRAEVDGMALTFEVVDGRRRDVETGSFWDFEGNAFAGPLEDAKLEALEEAYLAYWFAWAEFQPDTRIWDPPTALSVAPDFVALRTPEVDPDGSLARR